MNLIIKQYRNWIFGEEFLQRKISGPIMNGTRSTRWAVEITLYMLEYYDEGGVYEWEFEFR